MGKSSTTLLGSNINNPTIWVLYKRYSSFVTLHEQMTPYFKSMQIEGPPLPPRIENRTSTALNASLTQRKKHLQEYLSALILLLSDRMPAELLLFLGVHEQEGLGFNTLELIRKISQINLIEGDPKIVIGNNTHKVIEGVPKVYYQVDLKYTCYPGLVGESSDQQEETMRSIRKMASSVDGENIHISCLKSYGDFKQLHEFIKETQIDFGSSNATLPDLPSKHNAAGSKLDTNEMMSPLEGWMQQIVNTPQVARMLSVRSFFCLETIDQSQAQQQQSPDSPNSSLAEGDYGNGAIFGGRQNHQNSLQDMKNTLTNAIFE